MARDSLRQRTGCTALRRAPLLAFSLLALAGEAAAPDTATFDADAEGWTTSGSPAWSAVSGLVQAAFAPVGFPSPGENGAMQATNGASGGAFTGDYAAAAIERAGFDFLALSTNPSSLTIEWIGGTNTYYRDFTAQLGSPGSWFRLEIDFSSRAAGGWGGGPADEAVFAASRSQVTRFTVRIARRGTAGQTYQIDNVFLDRRPAASAIAPPGPDPVVTWTNLRTVAESRAAPPLYRIESTPDLLTNWSSAASFQATGRVQALSVPLAESALQIRLAR